MNKNKKRSNRRRNRDLRWASSHQIVVVSALGAIGEHRRKKIEGVMLSPEDRERSVSPKKAFWVRDVDDPTKFTNLARVSLRSPVVFITD